MIMVGDMFNNALKYRVDQLCNELSALVRSQGPAWAAPASSQFQPQGSRWRQKGILTEEEFAAKKAELLARL